MVRHTIQKEPRILIHSSGFYKWKCIIFHALNVSHCTILFMKMNLFVCIPFVDTVLESI